MSLVLPKSLSNITLKSKPLTDQLTPSKQDFNYSEIQQNANYFWKGICSIITLHHVEFTDRKPIFCLLDEDMLFMSKYTLKIELLST